MLLLQGKIKIQKIILKISNDALFVEKQDIVKKKKPEDRKFHKSEKKYLIKFQWLTNSHFIKLGNRTKTWGVILYRLSHPISLLQDLILFNISNGLSKRTDVIRSHNAKLGNETTGTETINLNKIVWLNSVKFCLDLFNE